MATGWFPGSNVDQNPLPAGVAAPTPTQNSFNSAYSATMAYNAPTLLQSQLGINQANRNIGYGNEGYGLDSTGMQLQAADQLMDARTRIGVNQIDLAAAQRQPNLIDQLLGLDNQDYGIQRADAGLTAKQDKQSLESDATAKGAFVASGTNDQRRNIFEALVNRLGHIDVSQQKNTLTAAEQKQQAQDRINTLNLQAQNYGMKPEMLQQILDNGLAKLGLDHRMSTEDLLDAVSKNNLQAIQLKNEIVAQAGAYATAAVK